MFTVGSGNSPALLSSRDDPEKHRKILLTSNSQLEVLSNIKIGDEFVRRLTKFAIAGIIFIAR